VKHTNSLLKVAAVASSVLLLSGFVCYRAGAFGWLVANTTIMSGSKSTFNVVDAALPATPGDQAPATVQQPPAGATQSVRVIMSGTKSMIGHQQIIGLEPAAPRTKSSPPATESQQPVPPTVAPLIMSSTKSAEIFLPPRAGKSLATSNKP